MDWSKNIETNKKLLYLTMIIFGGGIAVISFFQHDLFGGLPPITNDEINKVLDLIRERSGSYIIRVGDDFIKKESLINLVHIKRYGSEYKISCWFGPAYETASLNMLFPEELVSMGQIKECNAETAKAIDEAVRSREMDCRVFMGPTPSYLTDYYFFAIVAKELEVTEEWIEALKQKWIDLGNPQALKCFEPLEEMLGDTISKPGTGIIDLKKNIIYY